MNFDKTKIKKIEAACFFFKEKMNLQMMTDETIREMESSPLENLLSSWSKKKRVEFRDTSKELRRTLQAEGDMFLAYDIATNGKEGFVVTSKGVYVKSDGIKNYVDFEMLSEVGNLRFEDNELRGDGNLLAVFDGSEEAKERMIYFFEELIAILNGTYNADDD